LIGLTSLWINGRGAVTPEINHRRALIVLGKIDKILSWEKTKERQQDVHFVELGERLCEVRAKQYWRLERLRSFDEFLERRFPGSRRKAYYLMAIHEKLTRVPKQQLREVGWSKAIELVKVARGEGEDFDSATCCTKPKRCPRRDSRAKSSDILLARTRSPGKSSISSSTRVRSRLWRKHSKRLR
jgi:hypothetical protein